MDTRNSDSPARSTLRLDQRYPSNFWWAIATTEEITSTPISRQLLQKRVVLVRAEDGTIIALDDRCPHRRAPLSQGRLVNGQIECRYHGFRFNREGRCSRIPSEAAIPSLLAVRSYPVQEHGQFVWLWMGDADKAIPELLPQVSSHPDVDYLRIGGYVQADCSYMLVLENIMDPAHFQFLHTADHQARTKLTSDSQIVSEYFRAATQVTGRTVCMTLKKPPLPPTELEVHSMGLKAGDLLQKSYHFELALPSCWMQQIDIHRLSASGDLLRRHFCNAIYCVTPISPSRTHWWWQTTQDYGSQLAKQWQEACDLTTNEDKEMLEAVQASIDEDTRGQDARDLLITADRAVIDIRRVLKAMVEAEV